MHTSADSWTTEDCNKANFAFQVVSRKKNNWFMEWFQAWTTNWVELLFFASVRANFSYVALHTNTPSTIHLRFTLDLFQLSVHFIWYLFIQILRLWRLKRPGFGKKSKFYGLFLVPVLPGASNCRATLEFGMSCCINKPSVSKHYLHPYVEQLSFCLNYNTAIVVNNAT